MTDFVKWCFSDLLHGFVTLVVLSGVGEWSIQLARALRGRK